MQLQKPPMDLTPTMFCHWQKAHGLSQDPILWIDRTPIDLAQISFVIAKSPWTFPEPIFVNWQNPPTPWPKAVLSLTSLLELGLNPFCQFSYTWPKKVCHWQNLPELAPHPFLSIDQNPLHQASSPERPGHAASLEVSTAKCTVVDWEQLCWWEFNTTAGTWQNGFHCS